MMEGCSTLQATCLNQLCPMQESEDEIEPYYEVEKVVGKRTDKGSTEYQIKWKGFKQKTWEPLSGLVEVAELIDDYEREQDELRRNKMRSKNQKYIAKTINATKKIAKEDRPLTAKKKMIGNYLGRMDNNPTNQNENMNGKPEVIVLEDEEDEILASKRSRLSALIDTIESNPNEFLQKPRTKVTKIYEEVIIEDRDRTTPDLYRDKINRLTGIEVREGKWMVLVEFNDRHFSPQWYERDLVRLIHPMQLLLYYEKLEQETRRRE